MKLEQIKCPNCGASMDVDEKFKRTKCEFCNSIFVVKKDYQNIIEDPLVEVKIIRKTGLTGYACKMICYIDGKEVCRLKEGESYLYESICTKLTFKCRLTLGNPMSDEVEVSLMKGNVIIEAKQGIVKPSIKVKYEDEK